MTILKMSNVKQFKEKQQQQWHIDIALIFLKCIKKIPSI